MQRKGTDGRWFKTGCFLAKREAGGPPLKRLLRLMLVGLPLDYAHPEPSHRHVLPPWGRALRLGSGVALKSDKGRLTDEIDHSVGDHFIQGFLEGDTMSSTNQANPSHSSRVENAEGSSSSCKPNEPGKQQPRSVRLTVSLPGDLVDRLRDAVYWSPSLTLAWLIAQSLRTSLAEMESLRRSPFPKRPKALRAGRPRLVGQTMNVSLRDWLTASAPARSAEGSTTTRVPHPLTD